MGYGVLDFGFCPAGTPRRDDRPPTHFFVKKKFIPTGGAETATQKVPSVFCYARDFLCGAKCCATHGIPQAGLPSDGGIPAMPPTFLRNVWERGPVGPEGQRWWKDSDRGAKSLPAEPVSVVVLHLRLSAAQELPRTQEGAFFFTKKAYCGNQTLCVAGGRKSVQTQPPLFPPLKRWDSKGTRLSRPSSLSGQSTCKTSADRLQ